MDMFSALLGKSLSGGGGSEPVLISKSISSNGTYDASDDNADGYSSVSVSVPNSYTAADEDKVVHNGELVAQGSDTVTTNGTVDTTLISSLVVNVSGGSGGLIQIAKLTTQNQYVTSADIYIAESNEQFFIFGTMSCATTDTIKFDIPSSFNASSIYTHRTFPVFKSISHTNYNPGIATISLTDNNTKISIKSAYTNDITMYFGAFSKST